MKDVTQQLAEIAEKICAKLEHPTASVTYLDQEELRAALTAYDASRAAPEFGPLDPAAMDLGTWRPDAAPDDVVERVAKAVSGALIAAFKAGWGNSSEGYNAEYGPLDDDVTDTAIEETKEFARIAARAALSALPARAEGTRCFECDTELHGPYCPKCAQADDALEALRESTIGLCAAIDNLWNHPDLVRVRSEIPESIKLNISRHQMQVRTKLAAPAQRDDGWMPIETAPKGPGQLILGHSEQCWIRFGRYYPEFRKWYYSGTNERQQYSETEGGTPTHWRPLPAPPAPARGEG